MLLCVSPYNVALGYLFVARATSMYNNAQTRDHGRHCLMEDFGNLGSRQVPELARRVWIVVILWLDQGHWPSYTAVLLRFEPWSCPWQAHPAAPFKVWFLMSPWPWQWTRKMSRPIQNWQTKNQNPRLSNKFANNDTHRMTFGKIHKGLCFPESIGMYPDIVVW